MIELTFREPVHPGYIELLSTPRMPAMLTIADNITVTFSDLFVGGQVATIDRRMREQMLAHPILMVGGPVAALVHVTVTLRLLQGTRYAIEALNYFLPGTGSRVMIAERVFVILERDPDPDWLLG